MCLMAGTTGAHMGGSLSMIEILSILYFDVMRSIKQEFDANGISIPFPQRDVHLYQQISEK